MRGAAPLRRHLYLSTPLRMPSGGSAPVPALRGARAVLTPLWRARAAPAPIWRARAVAIAPLVQFREVAEARLVVVVVGTAAGAAARAPVGVVNGAAHHLRYRAAALGRAALEARGLIREHVGAAVGAPPVAISPGRAAALAAAVAAAATLAAVVAAAATLAAVVTATSAAVTACVNVRAMWVCGLGVWLVCQGGTHLRRRPCHRGRPRSRHHPCRRHTRRRRRTRGVRTSQLRQPLTVGRWGILAHNDLGAEWPQVSHLSDQWDHRHRKHRSDESQQRTLCLFCLFLV